MVQHFSFTFFLLQHNFFHSGYVIKPPQPSSAINGAPPFTGNLHQTIQLLIMMQLSSQSSFPAS